MKRPDQDPLLKGILEDEKLDRFRRDSLDRALVAMRSARRTRQTARMGMLGALPALVILLFITPKPVQKTTLASRPANVRQNTPPASAQVKEPTVKLISDDELFALFPDRPVALIGKPGHQQLVLLDTPTRN